MVKVAIVNACTVLTDQQIAAWVPALQTQVDRDFSPAWTYAGKSAATLGFVPRGQPPPKDAWWIAVLDNADVAGVLGYHDFTSAGLPIAKVFAATSLADGVEPSSDVSHELLEMLGDSTISLCVQQGAILYARELCDPCEVEGYAIAGVQVSNFVRSAYFDSVAPSGKFDFLGQITAPRTLLPGGYQLLLDLRRPHPTWQQVMAEQSQKSARKVVPATGSRRERRMRKLAGAVLRASKVAVA